LPHLLCFNVLCSFSLAAVATERKIYFFRESGSESRLLKQRLFLTFEGSNVLKKQEGSMIIRTTPQYKEGIFDMSILYQSDLKSGLFSVTILFFSVVKR
jgi:hypothetical protein